MPTVASGKSHCQISHATSPHSSLHLGGTLSTSFPFRISSAPEHFQCQILAGQEGALCHMDDMLIFGHTQQEHDSCLNAALTKIQEAGLTRNTDKCELNKTEIHVLRHVITRKGISPDPQKTKAVLSMDKPCSQTELCCFMGMTNQLGKFSSKIAKLSQPLREFLGSNCARLWGPVQDAAFEAVKAELAHPSGNPGTV